jgi:hypothetical protein
MMMMMMMTVYYCLPKRTSLLNTHTFTHVHTRRTSLDTLSAASAAPKLHCAPSPRARNRFAGGSRPRSLLGAVGIGIASAAIGNAGAASPGRVCH